MSAERKLPVEYVLLGLLALLWGSSYLFIKIGLAAAILGVALINWPLRESRPGQRSAAAASPLRS